VAEIGSVIGGRYRLQELLGEGSFAAVFRAEDMEQKRDVAVKMLRPEYAASPDFMSDFRWQARAAASLRHVNIASVLDFGTDPLARSW
jgi:eukaryotic-like serine/threonine-protein kinase